jgi:hypothetical protein
MVLHSGKEKRKKKALPENIRIGWKGVPFYNTLADYKNP